MVATGSLNTITAGYQQRSLGHGVLADGSLDPVERPFDHPYLQATGMMLGECLCMVAYLIITRFIRKPTAEENKVQEEQKFNPLLLWPAAFFDLIGTCLNYVGMILSTPASFQMLRGSVIVFTALLSIVLLKKRPKIYQWIGIVAIIGGLCIVGAGDMLNKPHVKPLCGGETIPVPHLNLRLRSEVDSIPHLNPRTQQQTQMVQSRARKQNWDLTRSWATS